MPSPLASAKLADIDLVMTASRHHSGRRSARSRRRAACVSGARCREADRVTVASAVRCRRRHGSATSRCRAERSRSDRTMQELDKNAETYQTPRTGARRPRRSASGGRTGPVEPRTTSSGSNSSSSAGPARPPIWPTQQVDGGPAHRLDGLAHGGQRRLGAVHQRRVVEAHDRHVLRHVQPSAPRGPDRAERQRVAGADDAGDAGRAAGAPRPGPLSSEYMACTTGRRLDAGRRSADAGRRPACGWTARGRRAEHAARSACGRATIRWPMPAPRRPRRRTTRAGSRGRRWAALTSTVGRLRSASRR